MQTINVKTFNPSKHSFSHAFFILSKGKHAGRPMHHACPNCFVVRCNTEAEKQLQFSICYALWVSGSFREYLVGSVIEFLRIDDARKLLHGSYRVLHIQEGDCQKFSRMLQHLIQLEETMRIQMKKVTTLKGKIAKEFLTSR